VTVTLDEVLRRTEPGAGGCLLWAGPDNGTGYGVTTWEKKQVLVHRLVYSLSVGEIPERHEIHHLCRVKRCCNPQHLDCVEVVKHRRIDAPKRDGETGRFLPAKGVVGNA